MLIVVGLSAKNLNPRFWDATSPYHLTRVGAVMVSYGEFHQAPALRRRAMNEGLRAFLGVPANVQVYLDNGSFYFLRRDGNTNWIEYDEFVKKAKPDWYPIPRDYIPAPSMTLDEQRECLRRTFHVNLAYRRDGYVPVIHASQVLSEYVTLIRCDPCLMAKPIIAIGGLVPNLLRTSRARPYSEILDGLKEVRQAFSGKRLHVFGVGGNSTLHVAGLLGFDSADSSGWRNRAIRGIVQLPGTGDRTVVKLGSWRGRPPSEAEWEKLRRCPCPGCAQEGTDGLTATGMRGFSTRAIHNLWVLMEEAQLVEQHLADGSYASWYTSHLDNTVYRPLIDTLVTQACGDENRPQPTYPSDL